MCEEGFKEARRRTACQAISRRKAEMGSASGSTVNGLVSFSVSATVGHESVM
jgi:hypothetical protein